MLSFWISCGIGVDICVLTDGTDSSVVGGIANPDEVVRRSEQFSVTATTYTRSMTGGEPRIGNLWNWR